MRLTQKRIARWGEAIIEAECLIQSQYPDYGEEMQELSDRYLQALSEMRRWLGEKRRQSIKRKEKEGS